MRESSNVVVRLRPHSIDIRRSGAPTTAPRVAKGQEYGIFARRLVRHTDFGPMIANGSLHRA